jgi:hypothetical protein
MNPTRAAREESGVIAIVVAISMSTFILGFAALAVDLGQAYLRKTDLQSLADRLTLTGAAGLPTIDDSLAQVEKTLTSICHSDVSDLPGICPDGGRAPNLAWATDHDPANGEISFYTDPDGSDTISLANLVSSSAVPSQAITVRLPPSRVQFGLAGLFGFSAADIQASATARIGTPLGSGILPFALTEDDVTKGQFCVMDPSVVGGSHWPGAAGSVRLRVLRIGQDSGDGLVATIALSVNWYQGWYPGALHDVRFFFGSSPDPVALNSSADGIYRVPLPPGPAGSVDTVWATGTQSGGYFRRGPSPAFVTNTRTLTYPGTPDQASLCRQPAADRGFVQLARPADDPGALTQNIRTGPAVTLLASLSLSQSVAQAVDCVSQVFQLSTSCLTTVVAQSFSASLASGLLTGDGNQPGRLDGNCGNGTTSANGYSGIDDSRLFNDRNLTSTGFGGPAALKDRLSNGIPAAPGSRGWITAQALRCPRLAVLAVIDPAPTGLLAGSTITSFRYVWIDDDATSRGLSWQGGRLAGFRGYVIDPGYLPTLVAGSRSVGPYLGGDMPKEALLVHDLDAPST